jgi:hypothetical protein
MREHVTVGNTENKQLQDSSSRDACNSFKRRVVSCIRGTQARWRRWYGSIDDNSKNYIDKLHLFEVPQTFNQKFSFNKVVPLHTRPLQSESQWINFSKWMGRADQYLGPLAPPT